MWTSAPDSPSAATSRHALAVFTAAGLLLGLCAPATAHSQPTRLRVVASGRASVTLRLRGVPAGVWAQGRWRAAGDGRWHRRRIGRGGRHRWRVGGLRAGRRYEFEARLCRGRRCGRWSAAELASTRRRRRHRRAHARGARARGLGCPAFPRTDAINQDVSAAPVDPRSSRYVASIGLTGHLHPDFGTDPSYGIPYRVVGRRQRRVPIHFTAYGGESDPGPYPIPTNAPVEGAGAPGDRHVLVSQRGTCRLFELYSAQRVPGGWAAGSGAVFNLRSDALRPDGWTSADAAGLPILPLLVRYDEAVSGRIDHALRVTVARTQRGYIHPATHFASDSTDPNLAPMGLRLRLTARFDERPYSGAARVVLTALKRYGMIVADNGSNWFLTGAPDRRWNDASLDQLKRVPGSAFEVVRTGTIHH